MYSLYTSLKLFSKLSHIILQLLLVRLSLLVLRSRASKRWRHRDWCAAKRHDAVAMVIVAMVSEHGGRRSECMMNAWKSDGMTSLVRVRVVILSRGGVMSRSMIRRVPVIHSKWIWLRGGLCKSQVLMRGWRWWRLMRWWWRSGWITINVYELLVRRHRLHSLSVTWHILSVTWRVLVIGHLIRLNALVLRSSVLEPDFHLYTYTPPSRSWTLVKVKDMTQGQRLSPVHVHTTVKVKDIDQGQRLSPVHVHTTVKVMDISQGQGHHSRSTTFTCARTHHRQGQGH